MHELPAAPQRDLGPCFCPVTLLPAVLLVVWGSLPSVSRAGVCLDSSDLAILNAVFLTGK